MKKSIHWIAVCGVLVLAAASEVRADSVYQNASGGSPLLDLIQNAQSTLDVEIYTMSDPQVQSALLQAQGRGVRLRIVQEPKPVGVKCNIFNGAESGDNATCTQDKQFMQQVLAANGQYVPFNKALCGSGYSDCVEHGKMVVADSNQALISSGNFDVDNLCDESVKLNQCDRDYTYVTTDAGTISTLSQIFESDLAGSPYDLQSILSQSQATHLTVSPFSLSPLVSLINSATTSLQIEEQYLWQTDINQAITNAAQRGVKVYVEVEGACSYGKPSAKEVSEFQTTFSAMEQAGVNVRMFTKKNLVGGHPGYLHAKAIVVDGNVGWVGSVNGSDQAAEGNREFGFTFSDSSMAQALGSALQADFNDPASATWQDSVNCVAK